jgi:hypothetical protein
VKSKQTCVDWRIGEWQDGDHSIAVPLCWEGVPRRKVCEGEMGGSKAVANDQEHLMKRIWASCAGTVMVTMLPLRPSLSVAVISLDPTDSRGITCCGSNACPGGDEGHVT